MILKNLLWDYFGKFSGMLMQLLTSFVLMRLLNISDFGLIGMTLAVNGIATTFTNFGFASYIIQQPKEDEELQSSIFWFNTFLGIFLSALLIILSPTIAKFYNQPILSPIIKVCSIFIPLSMLTSIPNALLGKRLQFKQLNLRNIIVSAFCAVVGITAALNGLGVWSLVLQQGLNLTLNFIASYQLIKWKPSFVFNKLKFTGAFHFGKYIFLATLVESVYSRLDVFTIGKIYKMDSVGYYTRAQSLSGNVIHMSSKSILNVLFPVLTRHRDDKPELIKNYYLFFHHICFGFCLVSSFCYLFAEPGFVTFFKPKWAYAAVLFKIILLSALAMPLSELMLTIIEGRGNSKNYFYADIWKKVILYPTYIMLFLYNIESYLYILVLGFAGAVAINLFYLNKEIAVGYKKTAGIFLTYYLPTLVLSFLLDKLFVTGTNWLYAALKFSIILIALFGTLKIFPSPTVQLVLNKIKKKN